jgi:hypothetical protein
MFSLPAFLLIVTSIVALVVGVTVFLSRGIFLRRVGQPSLDARNSEKGGSKSISDWREKLLYPIIVAIVSGLVVAILLAVFGFNN